LSEAATRKERYTIVNKLTAILLSLLGLLFAVSPAAGHDVNYITPAYAAVLGQQCGLVVQAGPVSPQYLAYLMRNHCKLQFHGASR